MRRVIFIGLIAISTILFSQALVAAENFTDSTGKIWDVKIPKIIKLNIDETKDLSVDEKRAVMEILTAIKRAGADIVLTYHAKDVARWLQGR